MCRRLAAQRLVAGLRLSSRNAKVRERHDRRKRIDAAMLQDGLHAESPRVFALHQVRLAPEIERDEARDRPKFSRRSLLQGVDRVGRTRLEQRNGCASSAPGPYARTLIPDSDVQQR